MIPEGNQPFAVIISFKLHIVFQIMKIVRRIENGF